MAADKLFIILEKVTSFASSINPIFGLVSSLVGVVRKEIYEEEDHILEKSFQEINNKLKSIAETNKQHLQHIHIDEVKVSFGKHEDCIKHQYHAFNDMIAMIKKDPDNKDFHINSFKKIYEKSLYDTSLNTYYRGVMGELKVFSRPLLDVYLENCDEDRDIMEHHCSHIAHLFQIGLIAAMAYTTITDDDEEELRKTWMTNMENIQKKMEEVLLQCKDKSS